MFLRIKSIYRFCDKSTNYHKATGSLPGRSNVEIKQNLEKFQKIYQNVDPLQLKKQQVDDLRIKFMLQNKEAQLYPQNVQSDEVKANTSMNGYLKFMGIFSLLMLIYLTKETHKYFTNPRNVVLYDENTGKTYNTTKEEFERIKAEQKKNKDFKEFRLKVLNKTQQKNKERDDLI